MLHLFIQSSDEKHFPRQVSFVIDLLRNIQSNTGHTKASNMSWHPILGYCVSSPGTVRDPRIVLPLDRGKNLIWTISWIPGYSHRTEFFK